MSKATGHTTAAVTGTAVVFGRSTAGIALEAMFAASGMAASLLEVSEEGLLPAEAASKLAGSGVLIDANVEGRGRTSELLQSAEALAPSTALLVTAALYRPIALLARSLARPDRFAGLVRPAELDRTGMAEIVRTAETSDETVAQLANLVAQLGKKSIVVRDSPGFYSQRLSTGFLNEGMALVGEGVSAATVERAAVESGMSSGPLATLDVVSLKLSDELLHQELHDLEHASQTDGSDGSRRRKTSGPGEISTAGHLGGEVAHDHHGHDHEHDHAKQAHSHDHESAQRHARDHEHAHDHEHEHAHDHGHAHDHEHGRHDQKADSHEQGSRSHRSVAQPVAAAAGRAHKHAHTVKSRRMPESAVYVMEKMAHGYRRLGRDAGAGFYDYDDDGSSSLWSGLKAFERRSAKVPEEDVRDRLLFIQALEAVRCLEEGVVDSIADADAASISLCGFPAATGGAVQFINRLGTGRFVERARELAGRYGERFLPPAGLADHARRGEPLDRDYAGHTARG